MAKRRKILTRRKHFYALALNPLSTVVSESKWTPGEIEESTELHLDFEKLFNIAAGGVPVLPAVIQDSHSLEVLLIAYVDEEALRLSIREKRAVFYSTSRREIWRKGEVSGDILYLDEIRMNCEQNSLLFLVRKGGNGVCHTKNPQGQNRQSCYYRRVISVNTAEYV